MKTIHREKKEIRIKKANLIVLGLMAGFLLPLCAQSSTLGMASQINSPGGIQQENSENPEKLHLSREEKEFLDSLGVIQIMVDDNYSPISYYDSRTNEYGGIAVEVLDALSRILPFEYEIIGDENLDWSDKLHKIRDGEIHILGGASRSREREDYGYFTDTNYFTTHYALIKLIDNYVYLSDIWDINNYRIGLSRGLSINEHLESHLYDNAFITYYDSQDEAVRALLNREIDLYPYNEAVFKEDFFRGEMLDYEVAYSLSEMKREYAFFCPKSEEGIRLTLLLDRGMKQIDINQIIADRYQYMSNFAFYKNYLENIQKTNTVKTVILLLLGLSTLFGSGFAIFLNRESERKEKLIGEMKKLQNQLERQASHDALTGIPNRSLFNDRLNQTFSLAQRTGASFALLYMDLDEFKNINDTLGHDTGDILLKEAAQRLSGCVREADTTARLGGDEFIIILNDLSDKNYPALAARRIISEISRPFHINDCECRIGISIGISIYPHDALIKKDLIACADRALYRVKQDGRNRYFFFSDMEK